jgi:hypothetical protein
MTEAIQEKIMSVYALKDVLSDFEYFEYIE